MAQIAKKKIKITSPLVKIISTCLGVAVLAFSGYMLTKSVNELVTTAQLKQELNTVQSQLDTLKDEQTTLNEEKARLEDPTYVQNYARGTHLLSKSGEQVFILPKGE